LGGCKVQIDDGEGLERGGVFGMEGGVVGGVRGYKGEWEGEYVWGVGWLRKG